MRAALKGLAGLVLAITLAACGGGAPPDGVATAEEKRPVVLATTTSTQDSGLLEELVAAFEQATGHPVKTVAVGSGQAVELGRRGEADVVLAHSPSAERALLESGVAGSRERVMHNDFVLLGPDSDPARARGRRAVTALRRIAAANAPFVSRGDDSGTHAMELSLWRRAGAEPRGSWYQETGSGMGATLAIAAEKGAYTLSDRGTYLSNAQARDLAVMVDGGPGLLNVYHVIDITERAGPRVNARGGEAFADWILTGFAQDLIRDFGREEYGRALFTPNPGRRDSADPPAS
jgi:tungstate transport system substrate-binding protein